MERFSFISTESEMDYSILYIALQQRILPAVTFSSADEVLPVSEAIYKGGLRVMEVTFRTGIAAEAIQMIRKKFPDLYVGAATLLSIRQVDEAIAAGAQFGLAPGFNPVVCDYAIKKNFPFIPGVMTPSEAELAAEKGFPILKLFPAAQIDGPSFLKALNQVYRQLELKFVPMGGVSISNMQEYLELENVIAVGGSWLASRELILSSQCNLITERVTEALQRITNKKI
jgi:2-dehydro-3-deoxyphosphogluconate aldolase/(4S)-4-hydroxy-2-oxoglutarate aldolase